MRAVWLIAKGVLVEVIRRREIVVMVLLACLLILSVVVVDVFGLRGVTKFYREISLKIMSMVTNVAVIVLAARQLPREFETRTIYTILSRPIGRATFLGGKLLGVLLAAVVCFGLFMVIFVAGTLYLDGNMPWALFAQYVYLQLLMILILASLSFWLSLVMNLDAAMSIALLFYLAGSVMTNVTLYLYDFMSAFGKVAIQVMTFLVPQLVLFDLSEKTVHAEAWGPIPLMAVSQLTLYALTYTVIFSSFTLVAFRRRAL